MRALVALVALSACYPAPPANLVVDAPEGETAAREVIRDAWQEVMTRPPFIGIRLPDLDAELVWLAGECLELDVEGCAYGVYYPWSETIYLVDRGRISDSVLAHESLHYYLGWASSGDVDPGHTSAAWDYVGVVNHALVAAGL